MQSQASDYYAHKIRGFADSDIRLFDRMPLSLEVLQQVKRVHIVGICGTAMGSLAGLLCSRGYQVSGSDTGCYPPMSDMIAELGIEYCEGYDAKHLVGRDAIIIGNACGPMNVEAVYARDHHLLQLSIGEALRHFFLHDTKPLVVAGTHGKTTTSGLLAHTLMALGEDPGFMIGGVMSESGQSYAVGEGQYFVLEGDEYDTAYFDKAPKFLHYKPFGAIVTSLEFDHVDIYKDMEDYTQAFRFLAEEVDPAGVLILCAEDAGVLELEKSARAKVITYGVEHGDITAKDIEDIHMPIPGRHNLLNALSVFALLTHLGFAGDKIKRGIETFGGMKRRQEVVGETKGIIVIDDFAHHPTAVRETISAIRSKYPGRRVVAVFEPRSNTSRRKLFEEDYIEAFDEADLLCLKVPPLRHNDNPADFMDSERVVSEINKRGTEAKLYQTTEEIISDLTSKLQSGDVVLIMSNGSFDGIHQKLLREIEAK